MPKLEDLVSGQSLGAPRWEDPDRGFKVRVIRDGKLAQESEVDVYRESNPADSRSTQRYKYNVRKQRPLNLSDQERGEMVGNWLREHAEAGTLGQYKYDERDMAEATEFNRLFEEMNVRNK